MKDPASDNAAFDVHQTDPARLSQSEAFNREVEKRMLGDDSRKSAIDWVNKACAGKHVTPHPPGPKDHMMCDFLDEGSAKKFEAEATSSGLFKKAKASGETVYLWFK